MFDDFALPPKQAPGFFLHPLRRVFHEKWLRPQIPAPVFQHSFLAAPGKMSSTSGLEYDDAQNLSGRLSSLEDRLESIVVPLT